MKVTYQNSIQYKVKQRIERLPGKVILRADLADIADYRQISRALRSLCLDKKLAHLGKGVYAKMRPSVVTGEPVLDGAFVVVVKEALNRLNVKWEASAAEKAYNSGKSSQVPTSSRVCLKSRFNRKLCWGKMELYYEKVIG